MELSGMLYHEDIMLSRANWSHGGLNCAIPLNRKRVGSKVKVDLEAVRVEVVEQIIRHGRANLGARHGRLIGDQRGRDGSRRLDHGKRRQLHRHDTLRRLLGRVKGCTGCGIRRDNKTLQTWSPWQII